MQFAFPRLLVGSSVAWVGCSREAHRLGRLGCAFLSHRLPVALSNRPQEAGALLGVGVVRASHNSWPFCVREGLVEDLGLLCVLTAVWVMGTPHRCDLDLGRNRQERRLGETT